MVQSRVAAIEGHGEPAARTDRASGFAGTLRPHPEHTATGARHGQLMATATCYQTGA